MSDWIEQDIVERGERETGGSLLDEELQLSLREPRSLWDRTNPLVEFNDELFHRTFR